VTEAGICESCWERSRKRVAVFRVGLCRNCWSGETGRAEEQREFRESHAAAVRRKWKDPAFRERNAAAVRRSLAKRWKDPAFRESHAAAVRRKGSGSD